MATINTSGKSAPALRTENRRLLEELCVLRAKVAAMTERVDLAEKSSRDAWLFAKVALRTGRPRVSD